MITKFNIFEKLNQIEDTYNEFFNETKLSEIEIQKFLSIVSVVAKEFNFEFKTDTYSENKLLVIYDNGREVFSFRKSFEFPFHYENPIAGYRREEHKDVYWIIIMHKKEKYIFDSLTKDEDEIKSLIRKILERYIEEKYAKDLGLL